MSPPRGSFVVFRPTGADIFDARTTAWWLWGTMGDEGQREAVDVLADRADFRRPLPGRCHAGHTVFIGDSQFVLRQIPSGILHPQVLA